MDMSLRNKLKIIKQLQTIPKGYSIGALKRAIEFYNNSSASQGETSVRSICRELRILTHTIEKGLSLPAVKKGFGKGKVKAILHYLDLYLKIGYFSYDHGAFEYALMTLEEYINKADQYDLDISFIDLSKYKKYLDGDVNRKYGVVEFSNSTNAASLDFAEFTHTRHSIRKFSETAIPEELMRKVIDLANSAPSACNRQSVRIFHIANRAVSRQILDIQGGARGHSQSELLLLASDLSLYRYLSELELPYLDGGIYLMNLLYALHYYQLASCPLVWDDYGENGKKLRDIIEIPQGYHVIAVVQCGFYPEDGGCYAVSNRRDIDSIYTRIDGAISQGDDK